MGKYFKYAFGEILLVVIGILIALQINNWNSAAKDRKIEKQLMSSFKIDIEKNIKELNRVIRKSERISKTADSILNYKLGTLSIPLENEDLARMLMRSESFTVYSTSEGTISDIFGSGKLDVIQNDSLRRAIASWNANLKHLREYEKIEVNSVELYRECIDKYLKLYTQDPQLILDNENKSKVLNDVVLLNALTERKFNPSILNRKYKGQLDYLEQLLKVIENNYD